MKLQIFPFTRRAGVAAFLVACIAALPLTSEAQRSKDARRDRAPSARAAKPTARPVAKRPPAASRPKAPQRSKVAARPNVQRRSPVASRPNAPKRAPAANKPSVASRSAARPAPRSQTAYNKAYPGRRPAAANRPSVQRPSVAARPSADRSNRPDVRRPSIATRPDGRNRAPSANRPDRSIRSDRYRDDRTDRSRLARPLTPYEKAYPGRRAGVVAAAHGRDHWRYHDSSRFSKIDRRVAYRSYPRSHYRLSRGNGYRGLGWYFGPPNVSYYYENPGVSYYSARSYAPASYVNLSYSPASSLDYSVQESLAELGYYDGPIDGAIGPASRMAIANYQADNGLEPTGIIDEPLVNSLGIQ